jgi:hypothetical protein
MAWCAKCGENFEGELTSCPKCGGEIISGEKGDWLPFGRLAQKPMADLAHEVLEAHDIPNIIISQSGYFGQVGLNFPSISGKGMYDFVLYIPSEFTEAAEDILNARIGDAWEKIVEE